MDGNSNTKNSETWRKRYELAGKLMESYWLYVSLVQVTILNLFMNV